MSWAGIEGRLRFCVLAPTAINTYNISSGLNNTFTSPGAGGFEVQDPGAGIFSSLGGLLSGVQTAPSYCVLR